MSSDTFRFPGKVAENFIATSDTNLVLLLNCLYGSETIDRSDYRKALESIGNKAPTAWLGSE